MSRIQNLFSTGHVDPESRNRVLLISSIVLVVAVSFALIAVGYYVDRIAPNNDTVFTVGGRKFSYSYLQDRIDAAYVQGQIDTSNLTNSIATVVSNIQNEELTRLIARDEGVTISDAELDDGMRKDLGVSPDASRNVFATELQNHLKQVGLSLDQYKEIIKVNVIQQKMVDQLEAGIPDEMEEVQLNLILVKTDAEAAQARDRIVNGEDFGEVAKDVSQHSSAQQGGAIGWTPHDLLVAPLADDAFNLEVGKLSDVIQTDNGYYLLRIDGKETRQLEDTTKLSLAKAYFGDKLEAASNTYELQNLVTVGQAQRIASHLQQVSGG